MWKKAIGVICAGGLSVMCLTGCGGGVADHSNVPSERRQKNSNSADDPPVNKENNPQTNDSTADSFGDLQGSVVEFSETGFSLSPATTETEAGGGEVMKEAAPGFGKDEDNIQISYTDDTVFQIVTHSLSSYSEVSREDTDKESVKKRSSVGIFGSCQDSHHWTADKILIHRWQE